MQSFVVKHTDEVATALAGGPLPARSKRLQTGQITCYDAGGTLVSCAGSGQDGEQQIGRKRRYVDNGDGTISDLETNLTWQKLI